jgi:hypothetical protein
MRNPYEVLRQKEMDLARLRQEVEVLQFVAPLLGERSDPLGDPPEFLGSAAPPRNRWPLEVEELPEESAEL